MHLEYKQGKKKGMKNHKLRAKNILKCDHYVQFMTDVKQDSTRMIAFVNERYIGKNYQRHENLLFNTNNEQDL